MTKYSEIKKFAEEIQKQWEREWKNVDNIESLPNGAGIYRLVSNQAISIPESYKVCGRDDAVISGELPKDTTLSVGKTKRLKTRIKQHFGDNKHNNRLKKRLESIKIGCETFCPTNPIFSLQYREIENWWERDMLEAYGKAICGAFFDLEVEH